MKDKLVFGIRSCQVPPYPERAKECLDTWGKDAKDLGYTVKVLLGNPNLYSEYYDTQDTLWSRAVDYDVKKRYRIEMFEKTVFYPCKWFLNETDYEYFFITDSDNYIDIDKFIPNIKNAIDQYKEVDYMGCCCPFQGWDANNPHIEYIPQNVSTINIYNPFWTSSDSNIFAHGGSGFLLSRKASKIILNNFNTNDYHSTFSDDIIVADILYKQGINLLHNGHMFWDSPFEMGINYQEGTKPPYIGDSTGNYLISQHYVSGKMKEIEKYIKKL